MPSARIENAVQITVVRLVIIVLIALKTQFPEQPRVRRFDKSLAIG